jgi:hypothetical protein
MHTYIKVVDSTVIKNGQTYAKLPASQNVPQILIYEFLKYKKKAQFQIPRTHSPSSHDTRHVTSLRHLIITILL